MSEEIMVPMKDQRDISTVTTEIRTLHRQAQRMILGYAIEIGRRLTEAKEMLPHGQWGEWLKTEVEFSQSTAQNFMRIFEEYGNHQISLFGDAKSQTLGNLPYTHALKLLAVPADEREQFVEEHRVEDLSSRELEKLIRERDAAKNELVTIGAKLEGTEVDLKKAKAAQADAEERARIVSAEWKAKLEKEQAEVDRLREEAAKAAESAKKAKEKLKALKENPEVPAEVLEKLKEDVSTEAQEKLEAARAEAEAKVVEAEKAAAAAVARAEAAEKKLRTADAETAAFKARFVDIQGAFSTLRKMWRETTDEEKATGMARAVRALLEREKELWG